MVMLPPVEGGPMSPGAPWPQAQHPIRVYQRPTSLTGGHPCEVAGRAGSGLVSGEVLGHGRLDILVILHPTGYMLTSSGFVAFI